jgi:hypothetical protein
LSTNITTHQYCRDVLILHVSIFYSSVTLGPLHPLGSFPRLCPTNIEPQRSSFEAPATLRYPFTTTSTPPLPHIPPPTCLPAVSPPAALASPRRASKPSPRGVSPRPQRSMRSLLSLSSALMEPTPARWYVTDGCMETTGRQKRRETDTSGATNSTPQPPSPPPSMPSPRPWRTSTRLSRRTPNCRTS